MSKRTFVVFGLVVAVLAVVIPWLAFQADGDADAGPEEVSAQLEQGQALFETNCGNCHTLSSAGTDGNFGPDLDMVLAPTGPVEDEKAAKQNAARVLAAIEEGVDNTAEPGRMPAGIISGPAAEEVAEFVARTAGRG